MCDLRGLILSESESSHSQRSRAVGSRRIQRSSSRPSRRGESQLAFAFAGATRFRAAVPAAAARLHTLAVASCGAELKTARQAAKHNNEENNAAPRRVRCRSTLQPTCPARRERE